MNCETVISLALQLSAFIVASILGLITLMIKLIKLSQKEK